MAASKNLASTSGAHASVDGAVVEVAEAPLHVCRERVGFHPVERWSAPVGLDDGGAVGPHGTALARRRGHRVLARPAARRHLERDRLAQQRLAHHTGPERVEDHDGRATQRLTERDDLVEPERVEHREHVACRIHERARGEVRGRVARTVAAHVDRDRPVLPDQPACERVEHTRAEAVRVLQEERWPVATPVECRDHEAVVLHRERVRFHRAQRTRVPSAR